jgi:hypothetical protein
MAWMDTLEPHWFWLALGLILAIGEMVIPGVFLIWLAGSAILTGLVAWLLPIGMPLQIVLFVAVSLVSVFMGKRYLAANPIQSADPKMNDRGARAVGAMVQVTQAIEAGSGRVKLGDSEWLAQGPDAGVGTRMRVVAADGVILIVEHLQ